LNERDFLQGTVLWFRPEVGKGVIKADNGRQFFFGANSGITDPVKGLRLLVRSVTEDDGVARVELKLPPGGREFFSVAPTPRPSTTKRRAPKTRKTATKKSSKPKTGPKRGVVKRVVRAGESLERGISVLHTVHGQGFVVLSTSSMARIRFMPSQEERSVRVSDLEILEGN
jgi:cold shock CspA family protein